MMQIFSESNDMGSIKSNDRSQRKIKTSKICIYETESTQMDLQKRAREHQSGKKFTYEQFDFIDCNLIEKGDEYKYE